MSRHHRIGGLLYVWMLDTFGLDAMDELCMSGLHVIGRIFDDARVLRICAAYEEEVDFAGARAAGF